MSSPELCFRVPWLPSAKIRPSLGTWHNNSLFADLILLLPLDMENKLLQQANRVLKVCSQPIFSVHITDSLIFPRNRSQVRIRYADVYRGKCPWRIERWSRKRRGSLRLWCKMIAVKRKQDGRNCSTARSFAKTSTRFMSLPDQKQWQEKSCIMKKKNGNIGSSYYAQPLTNSSPGEA